MSKNNLKKQTVKVIILLGLAIIILGFSPVYAHDLAQNPLTGQIPGQQAALPHIGASFSLYMPLISVNPTESGGRLPNGLPTLDGFIQKVSNGDGSVVRGVYAPDLFASPVTQQPSEHPEYVSSQPNVITQYQLSTEYGVLGLLAHNHLAGRKFSSLQIDQKIYIIFGDGSVKTYQIAGMEEIQAVEPTNPYSNFIDTQTGEVLNSYDVFVRFYTGDDHVTLQTCIKRNGNSSWGRLMITALPVY